MGIQHEERPTLHVYVEYGDRKFQTRVPNVLFASDGLSSEYGPIFLFRGFCPDQEIDIASSFRIVGTGAEQVDGYILAIDFFGNPDYGLYFFRI